MTDDEALISNEGGAVEWSVMTGGQRGIDTEVTEDTEGAELFLERFPVITMQCVISGERPLFVDLAARPAVAPYLCHYIGANELNRTLCYRNV